MNAPVRSLASLLQTAEVFVDGDWVESKDQDPNGDVRLIQLADIGDGHYVDKSDRFLTSQTAKRLKCTYLKAGDVLVARMPDPIGRACIFPGDSKSAVTVVDVCVIRVNEAKTCAGWLMHALNSPRVRAQIEGFATGTTRSRISRGNLAKVEIPVPPLPEQRRIADILEKVDGLRTKRRESLAQVACLPHSIFVEMFGDPVSNPMGWPTRRLGSLTTKMGSGSTPTGGDAAYKDSGISLIRSMNVHDARFVRRNLAYIDATQAAKLANVVVEADDVLLNITGASVARVCRAPRDVLPARVNQHVMIIRPSGELNPVFLEALLLDASMKTHLLNVGGAGATREAITKAQAQDLAVIHPPKELQQEFVRRAEHVLEIQRKCELAQAELDRLFSSLQHRAFGGALSCSDTTSSAPAAHDSAMLTA